MSNPVGSSRADVAAKASVLVEALPWLEEFQGATVVVKYGGNAMTDDALKQSFAEDIVFLRRVGLRPVVVHGGGPQIGAMLDRLGIATEFKAGLRVTSTEALDVVRMVLTGKVQREIVGLINQHGPLAVGMSGEDAHLFSAARHTVNLNGQPTDVGHVGVIERVDASFVRTVLDDGLIPVVSSIARADDGGVYNVNADSAAASLAAELGAQKLIVLTDVEGLYADWPNTSRLMSEVSSSHLRELLPTLDSGMLPKMQACLLAVDSGVPKAHVLDGRLPHALLLEVFTDHGVGTQVTR
ncbi:MAG TPA: acetylglutamate kinase [Actinomycetes bacterium]|nr:acetylglutamate kinase [Actinomycetes bacterium]